MPPSLAFGESTAFRPLRPFRRAYKLMLAAYIVQVNVSAWKIPQVRVVIGLKVEEERDHLQLADPRGGRK